MNEFLTKFGLPQGGLIRCDEGGELSRSQEFREKVLEFHYTCEPTGADTPEQNGGVERCNDTLDTMTRSLLYGAALPAKYWSVVIVHAAYLLNRQCHTATKRTPLNYGLAIDQTLNS